MDSNNINAEYYRIFGVKHRASLFDNDEGYAQLRQEIINAPAMVYNKDRLPFEHLKSFTVDDFARNEVAYDSDPINDADAADEVDLSESLSQVIALLQSPAVNVIRRLNNLPKVLDMIHQALV